MFRIAGALVVCCSLAVLAACGSDSDEAPPTSTAATGVPTPTSGPASTTTPPTSTPEPVARSYEAGSCPVFDEDACSFAVEVIEALQAGDAERLLAMSRKGRLVCAELATEYFPDCRQPDDVLRGYALSGPSFAVDVVGAGRYRAELEDVAPAVDPSFSDELGDGGVAVVGVGTCGPDIPGRRTYHLAWTAAVGRDGAPAERVLGSFELTFEDDWRIGLWYFGPLEEWEREQPPDPLQLAFCEAGRSPWPAAS